MHPDSESSYRTMMVFWSQIIFITVSTISLPLYLLIIIVCLKEWKQNTFYLLIISQGAIDILVIMSYLIFGTLRASGLINDIFWAFQLPFLAEWCFIQIYISMIIRCFGILMISLQRYVSLCKNGTRAEQFINTRQRWFLPLIQWIFPIIYSAPLLASKDVTFSSRDHLEVIVRKEDITLAASMTLCFVFISFLLCCFCYGAVLKFLVNNRYNKNLSVKRETRLYVQMLGLFFAFILCVIYNTMQFFFSLQSNDGPIFTMRVVFPLVSCILSYINIYMMIILNKDMRKKVLQLFRSDADGTHSQTAIISIGHRSSVIEGTRTNLYK